MTLTNVPLLSEFLRDLGNAGGGVKDPEADRMINDALRASHDGAYVLVQHAILSDQALRAAQARIADLERQVPGAASFLGNRQAPPQTSVPPFPRIRPATGLWPAAGLQSRPGLRAAPASGRIVLGRRRAR